MTISYPICLAPLTFLISIGMTDFGGLLAFQVNPETSRIGVIDPRVETMFAIQLLAGYEETGLISEFESGYKKSMRDHFAPFANHAAVKLFKERMLQGFNFDAPLTFMLCHDSADQMKPSRPYSDSLLKRIGGDQIAEQFQVTIRDFANVTHAADFFRQQEAVFDAITTRARKDLQLENLIRQLEEYTGQTIPNAGIIFMPLGHQGGYGLHLSGGTRQNEAFALIGPTAMEDDQPVYRNDTSTTLLIWHELAHPIVNPTLDRYKDEIEKSQSAFAPIQERLRREACGEWDSCVKESVVRALVIRLAERHLGRNAALAQRVVERQRGWVYVDEIIPLLVQFEEKEKPSTFRSLIPQVLELLDMIAASVKGG